MNSGLYALAGDSATATEAACANRFDEPMTNVSNMYFGLSRFPSPGLGGVRRSSRPVPPPVGRCGTGGETGAGGSTGTTGAGTGSGGGRPGDAGGEAGTAAPPARAPATSGWSATPDAGTAARGGSPARRP